MEVKASPIIIIPVVLLALLSINVLPISNAESLDASTPEPVHTVSQPKAQTRGPNAPATTLIQVLQVYPDGHNTTAVAQAISTWSTMFHIDVLPVTAFNTCATVTCTVSVIDPLTAVAATHPINYYDVLYFGVADNYGHYDLSTSSVSVVREFAKLGRGIVFTHDTVANWADGSSGNPHPNFTSLIDVHGLSIGGCPLQTFTKVKLVSDNITDPVLNSPFRFPSSFDTLNAHWGCQNVISGTAWYNGTDSSLTTDYHLYMQTYFNEDYGSHSAFYSYGHTEDVPMEWEAKAMINSMWFAYRGSGPALELPVEYASYTNFATAAQGNVGGKGPGRVNSWYDHSYPTYCDPPNGSGVYDNKGNCTWQNNNLTRWDGHVFTFTNSSPSRIGESWYDGHNGIDFQRRLQNEPVSVDPNSAETRHFQNRLE